MAKNETNTNTNTARTQRKRLARAKVKHPEQQASTKKGGADNAKTPAAPGASKTTKARVAAQANKVTTAQQAKDRKQKWIKIGIGAFAVLMALSMMLPSLASVMSGMQQAGVVSDQQAADASAETTDEATDESTEETTDEATDEATDESAETEATEEEAEDTTGMAAVDASYKPELDGLLAKLDADENNLAAILNLGKLYMQWGYTASMYATDDASTAHVAELFDTAVSYYDRYLKLNDSSAAKVDRALCHFYAGDTDAAKEELTALTTEAPDYGPAWANLGYICESQYDTEGAKAAYEKAIEVDPNDDYGASSFASGRLASMNQAQLEEDGDAGIETSTGSGLSETLADASGVGF